MNIKNPYFNNYPKIQIDNTLRETVAHGDEAYPFCYYYEDVYQFDFHCVDWHWHPELEFVYVKTGSVTFSIDNDCFTLPAGSGIFINAFVLHQFSASESSIIPNFVFMPRLLAAEHTLIYDKYIRPILTSGKAYQVFSPDSPWQASCLEILQDIFALQESVNSSELLVQTKLLELWNTMFASMDLQPGALFTPSISKKHAKLILMLQYIHANYTTTISLEQIADCASISKSSALHIFQEYLQTTPVAYLIRHRLKMAARLLRETEQPVSSIALQTGFENTGYFCRKFKQLYAMTPLAYRTKP